MDKHLISPTCPEAQEKLKDIEIIYTDLDGTMLAPGGRVFVNHEGQPSGALGEAIYALKKVGVEIVVVTGRNRHSLSEIIRLLDLSGFMGEIGTVVQYGIGPKAHYYYETGQMEFDPQSNKTPYKMIEKSGIVQRIIEQYPGLLEYHTPWCEGREVTHMLRGRISTEEIQALLDKSALPLVITDNGRINPPSESTGLDLSKDIHVYHIMPKGTSKADAVTADIARRGIDKSKTAAIGDALTDVHMGRAAGVFCTVQNGLKSAQVVNEICSHDDKVIATVKPTVDGWVEFAQAVLQAKSLDQG